MRPGPNRGATGVGLVGLLCVHHTGVVTPIILYDADCGFCTRSARLLERLGAAASFAPLQRADLVALDVDPARAEHELPAVHAGGVAYGAHAIRVALATGPWWMRALAVVLGLPVIAGLAQVGYRWVAANRHRLPGGTTACTLEP